MFHAKKSEYGPLSCLSPTVAKWVTPTGLRYIIVIIYSIDPNSEKRIDIHEQHTKCSYL